MNIDSKGIAVIVLIAGGAVALAYNMGANHNNMPVQPTASTMPGNMPGQQAAPGAAAVPATSTMARGQGSAQQNAAMDLSRSANSAAMPTASGNGKFTHFRVGSRNVKGMLSDGDTVWVGTSGGAIRYDIKTDEYKIFDVNNGSLISNGVFHLSRLADRIMVGTYGGGMSAFDLKTEKWRNYNIPDGLADQFVYDIDEDEAGNYWIATWSGVNFVPGGNMDEPKGWETFMVENTDGGLPNDWVYGVEVGKDGNVWFATEGGLALLDKDRKWSNWQHKDGLGADYDEVKNDIAFKNDPAKASKHHARQKAEQGVGDDVKVGYNPNYIVSMVVDNDGKVWCGTWGGGLSIFDGSKFTTYTVKDGLPGNHVFMLYKGKDGEVWIGTNKGLAKLKKDGKGFRVMTKADGLYADNVFSMTEANDGTLWVGSFGGVAKISNYKL
ncbi:MAG: two-component regulator propeller domain-containing protein [Thiohalomonadales bacterium]